MLLRDATIDDVSGIARVHVDTWRSAYAGIIPAEHLAGLSYERSAERLRMRSWPPEAGHLALVAEDGGQIVGFAVGGPERSGDPTYKGEVYALYVLPSHQDQGIGRHLLQTAARRLLANGVSSMLIWVLAENPARGFYERLGGCFVREQEIEIGGARLREVAYGWGQVGPLAMEVSWHAPFAFRDPGRLADGELELDLADRYPGDPTRGWTPSYRFLMTLAGRGTPVGRIELRVGNSRHILMYAGHIGYEVMTAHRGHHYAARACRLVFPLARSHGLNPLWITCNPDNWPSRRTCELLGARLVEIVDLLASSDMYRRGERQKCRYRVDL